MRAASVSCSNIEMMTNTICIQLKNNLSELESLNKVVAEFAERHHLSSKVLFNLNLALEEILTNVISYAYDDKDEHQITVRLFLEQGQMKVEVEDDGRPFNPLEAPEPDLSKSLEERPVGGLGIHLVRDLMDELENRRDEGRNLFLIKMKEP